MYHWPKEHCKLNICLYLWPKEHYNMNISRYSWNVNMICPCFFSYNSDLSNMSVCHWSYETVQSFRLPCNIVHELLIIRFQRTQSVQRETINETIVYCPIYRLMQYRVAFNMHVINSMFTFYSYWKANYTQKIKQTKLFMLYNIIFSSYSKRLFFKTRITGVDVYRLWFRLETHLQ